MSTPAVGPDLFTPYSSRRLAYAIVTASAVVLAPFLLWPGLTKGLFTADFLPHLLTVTLRVLV